MTNDEKYLKMALTASEKILTYVNVINYELKKDSKLTKMGIDTRGLSYASKKIRGMNTILPINEIKQFQMRQIIVLLRNMLTLLLMQ